MLEKWAIIASFNNLVILTFQIATVDVATFGKSPVTQPLVNK